MPVPFPKPMHRADRTPSFAQLLDSKEARSLLNIYPKTLQQMARGGEDEAELLTVEELSAKFKVPTSWIYERTRDRGGEQIPHYKLRKYLRFELTEVATWLPAAGELHALRARKISLRSRSPYGKRSSTAERSRAIQK